MTMTPLDPTLSPLELDAPEIAGYRDFWSAAPQGLAGRHGIVHRDLHGAFATAVTSVPGRLTTHALGLAADDPRIERKLQAVEHFYRDLGLPATVAVPEGTELEAQLQARGYRRDYAWVKFARDTAPSEPVDCALSIRPVAVADGERMGRMLAGAFDLPAGLSRWFSALVGRPCWHCLGAYDGSTLVGTGSLFVHGEMGWLTWAATDPPHRGRRAQKGLLAARIDLARDLGLRLLVVETGDVAPGRPDASFRNILAAGFEPAYRRAFWSKEPLA